MQEIRKRGHTGCLIDSRKRHEKQQTAKDKENGKSTVRPTSVIEQEVAGVWAGHPPPSIRHAVVDNMCEVQERKSSISSATIS